MSQLEVLHADAGLDLLEAVPGLTVYRDKLPPAVTGLAPPWVLVMTAVEWPYAETNNSIDYASTTCVTTWYCYASGTTGTSALAIGGIVRGTLLGIRPVITGRVCNQISQVSSEPPRQHEGTGISVLTALSIYELETRPAP